MGALFAVFKVLGTFITGGGLDGILTTVTTAWAKSKDINLATFQTATDAQKSTALAAIGYQTAQLGVERDLLLTAMTHPVWWWAWGLFVFPVGIYNAAIFLLSAAGVSPEVFAVLRVPSTQEEWAKAIIQTIFISQSGTMAVCGIAQAVSKAVSSKSSK